MPNRIIKDSINESRGLSECSFFAQDLYKRLITYADDYGRFNADTQIMLARLYPREIDIVSPDDLISALIELTGTGKIQFYTPPEHDGVYGGFPNWSKHQRIRDSKNKCPAPDDFSVNDWYLRRFIPIDMKVQILERDRCKCQICGRDLNPDGIAPKRLLQMCAGAIHFDHIVPCRQGGRATLENLRTTCAKCNLSRKKAYTFDEILQFSKNHGDCQQLAASCGEARQDAARARGRAQVRNPIQSNPNPMHPVAPQGAETGAENVKNAESAEKPADEAERSESLTVETARGSGGKKPVDHSTTSVQQKRFAEFWCHYPRRAGKGAAEKAWDKIRPDEPLLERILSAVDRQKQCDQWQREDGRYIPYPATWLNQKRWEDEPDVSEEPSPEPGAPACRGAPPGLPPDLARAKKQHEEAMKRFTAGKGSWEDLVPE